MKNKIAKKLFFSAVALGASVLTLTTTTYAWYVQNNTVTATNIQASTASNESGSLFISKDARPSLASINWGPTIAFDPTADFPNTDLGNEKNPFTPITYYAGTESDNTKPLYGKTGKFLDVNAEEVTGKVLTANFFLLSNRTSGVTVQPTLTVVNSTTSKTVQTAYAAVPSKTSGVNLVEENAKFWVDAVQALRMKFTTSTWDETLNSGAGDWKETSAAYYDVLEIAKQPKAANASTFADYVLATYSADPQSTVVSIDETQLGEAEIDSTKFEGAHAYYRRFVGKTPASTFVESNKDNLTHVSVDETTKRGKMGTINVGDKTVRVTVTIWLEGTDISCFDSCSGQTFNFGFDFTVA